MGKLYAAHHLPLLLSIFVIINIPSQSTEETLRFHHNTEHKIAFFINNILENNKKFSAPVLKNGNKQVPHHDLVGLFAGKDRQPNNPRWSFLVCMQALELGTIIVIDEILVGNYGNHRAAIIGKVQGIYVTGLKDNSSQLVAMKASFAYNGDLNDSLRFFGVHQKRLMEAQISVVGGSGKYNGANGFAMVKFVGGKMQGIEKKLLFNVYLKYEKRLGFL